MKRFILYTFLFMLALPALAQTEEPEGRHVLGLQLGIATVSGSFHDSAYEDEYPAFARDGLLMAGSYRYNFGRYLGAGASLSYRHNRYNLDAFAAPDDELVTGKSAEAWRSVFTLADVYIRVPMPEVMEVYLKGSAGASFNRSASWQVQTVYGDIHMPSDRATALALGWGSGISFNMHPFTVGVEAGMLFTRPEFTVADPKGNPLQHRQPMNSFNVSLGVQFRL
ncbi:outer membrane beta-barrel protein [Pontibacter anaerobius]|uniref:Outer membrane beta-barrel protein n=1 Tax=Pontibacter anaerobius TaxID=2993940 RepID=A0ABT3RIV6_9BACT|nr:outer membrane beta-barrel protein [Pontibacter anaerobius]MCX2741749.1 outer membrane beta-barrel protein [Pontibacter anaerobius]